MEIPERLTPVLSRRSFLCGMTAAMVLELSGSIPVDEQLTLPREDKYWQIPEKHDDVFYSIESARDNTAYIQELISELQHEIKDRPAKLEAVEGSLRRIRDWVTGATGTAFQIDESGIYITAKHVVPPPQDSFYTIHDPYSGRRVRVDDIHVHKAADLAIVFAPNGKKPKPISGIQIGLDKLASGQELWMVGLCRNDVYGLVRCMKYGRVDTSVQPPTSLYAKGTLVAVRGLQPFGGTSGSPIIDQNGTIVAVESGAFPHAVKYASEYEGATVAAMRYISDVPLVG